MLFQRSKGEPELSAAVGFPIQSRIKAISAENYNQTKSEATYTSCDFTWENGEKEWRENEESWKYGPEA